MTTLEAVTLFLAVACPLAVCLFAVLIVFALSGRRDDLPLFVADETPFEDEDEEPYVVDPPVVAVYVEAPLPDGMVMFRGGAVHTRCLVPYLRNGARPCAGCAVHLDHVLTGAA